jgi:hypothetical protein
MLIRGIHLLWMIEGASADLGHLFCWLFIFFPVEEKMKL